MKKIVLYLVICVFMACASESQKTGLDKIASHYGAKTSFSKGFSTNAGVTKTNFTIKVSNSKMLDTLRPDLVSSNIALMLYESFDENERGSYDNIVVELNRDTVSEPKKLVYAPDLLKSGLDQAAIFQNFTENIINQDFEGIASSMAPQFQTPGLATNLSNYWRGLKARHGQILGYKRTGFGVYTMADNTKYYYYSGILSFKDGSDRRYHILTSQDVSNNSVMSYTIDEYK